MAVTDVTFSSIVPLNYEALLHRCLHHHGLAQRLVRRYVVDMETYAQELAQQAEDGDWSNLAKTAHRWKGASLSVAAQPIADVLARIEQAAQDGDRSHVSALVRQLHAAMADLKSYIRQGLVGDSIGSDCRCQSGISG